MGGGWLTVLSEFLNSVRECHAGLRLVVLPHRNGATYMHIQRSNDAVLRNLNADVHHWKMLGVHAAFLVSENEEGFRWKLEF